MKKKFCIRFLRWYNEDEKINLTFLKKGFTIFLIENLWKGKNTICKKFIWQKV